jgi:hypothetical protein
MLRNFAAVLLATSLIAGPAFAAQSSDNAGSTSPATVTAPAHQTPSTKRVTRTHRTIRKHLARGKTATMKLARPAKPAKHRGHFATHVAKPAKVTKHAMSKGVKTARLHATRNVDR